MNNEYQELPSKQAVTAWAVAAIPIEFGKKHVPEIDRETNRQLTALTVHPRLGDNPFPDSHSKRS